jgi:hypothetical protein
VGVLTIVATPAGHSGDQATLVVDLPSGWTWRGEAPPATVDLDNDFAGTWLLSATR